MWRRVPAGAAGIEDVEQTALLALIEASDEWRGDDAAFLRLLGPRIVRAIRRMTKKAKAEPIHEYTASYEPRPDLELIHREQLARMAAEIGLLPERERMVLVLRFDDRMRLREIAAEMRLSKSAAAELLDKALRQLHENIS